MSMTIQWDITVSVPQLDTLNATLRELGEKLMERLDAIYAAITELDTNIAAQLTAIADEIAQLSAGSITDAELADIEQKIRTAAANIHSNTQQITTIVPDTPPA